MKKVVFRGPTMTQSGYGVHSRQVARWLLSREDVDVKFMVTPWGDTPWLLDRNSCSGLIGKVMDKTVGTDYKADVSIQLQLPNEWDAKLATKNVGMTAAVETDTANPEWNSCCNKMDSIVFPSLHAKNSITTNGSLTCESYIIPESFDDDMLSDAAPLELSQLDTNFNFLLFGQFSGNNPHNDRKNLLFSVKWLCEAFKDDPEVGIIIKTNSGRNTRIDRALVLKLFKSVLSEVRKGPYPKVHFLHGDMSDAEVSRLYRVESIKALVSLTRGEGFGLPLLEAAASGLPVIATNWSAHTEFLKHIKFVPIDYSLAQVHPSRVDGKIFMPGSKWAEPSEADFKKKIIKFRNSPSIPASWAKEGSSIIKEKYNFKEISRLYDQALEKFFT